MIPVIGEPLDLISGGIYAARGQWDNATLSIGSLLPFLGWGAGVSKISKNIAKVGKVVESVKILDRTGVDTALKSAGIGPGRTKNVKTLRTDREVIDLADKLMTDGKNITPRNYGNGMGVMVELDDLTRIGFRPASKSGGPVIDIISPGLEPLKIHAG